MEVPSDGQVAEHVWGRLAPLIDEHLHRGAARDVVRLLQARGASPDPAGDLARAAGLSPPRRRDCLPLAKELRLLARAVGECADRLAAAGLDEDGLIDAEGAALCLRDAVEDMADECGVEVEPRDREGEPLSVPGPKQPQSQGGTGGAMAVEPGEEEGV